MRISRLLPDSLGNFINAQDMADNMIGAILDVTFQKTTAADGTVTVEIQTRYCTR